MKLGKEEFAAECNRRRDAGLMLKHRGSYDAREQVKELGAIWDGQEKGWLMPDAASYARAYQLAEEQYPGGGKSAPAAPTETPQAPADTEDIPF